MESNIIEVLNTFFAKNQEDNEKNAICSAILPKVNFEMMDEQSPYWARQMKNVFVWIYPQGSFLMLSPTSALTKWI